MAIIYHRSVPISRYQVYFRTDYIQVTDLTVPTEWYHLVFNYIGESSVGEDSVVIYHNGAEVGRSTNKVSYSTSARQGVVVIGKHRVQSEQDFASVMVDELLFFNRPLSEAEAQILYNMHN